MKNLIFYLTAAICLFASKAFAQDNFETRAKKIADRIEKITKTQKDSLKIEVEKVNQDLEKGLITIDEANELKKKYANERALKIDVGVAIAQDDLKELINEKVNGKIKSERRFYIGIDYKRDTLKSIGERRTTSQFVLAVGVNNLVTDGSVDNSDFRYWGSHFYEWGTTWNTRILKNNNLLHAKYGFSVMYNNLRPTDNRYFVADGKETSLEVFDKNLKESRMRNVYVTVPLHLEFDFTKKRTDKDGKTIFKTHDSFRLGIGGYAGLRVKSKQILKYEEDDIKYKIRQKGDFNVNDFIYGLSAYVGYKETSLYIKYDLNPMFANNAIDQNNVSLGVRFDWN